MKKLTKLFLTALAVGTVHLANAVTFNPADLLLVFRQAGASDVEFDIGSVNDYKSLAANSTITVGYDSNVVTTAYGGFSGVSFAVAGTPALNDASPRVWLTGANLAGTPSDLTGNAYSTLASKLDGVRINARGVSNDSPYIVDSSDSHSYSFIVSPDDSGSIDTMGGDAPFTVEAVGPNSLNLFELVPTSLSPVPAAIKLGTFTLAGDGTLTFTASAVTPVVTAASGAVAVRAGAAATFTASVQGADGYQWYRNGVLISGATNSTYTVGNAQSANAGTYTVVGSNSVYGTSSAASAGAALTVTPAYIAGDLQLVFRQAGYSDVEYNIGSISNYLGLAANANLAVGYSNSAVVGGNFGGTLAGVSFAVVGTPSLLDPKPRVWVSDANLAGTPSDLTGNTYSTLASKIDAVATAKASVSQSFSAPLIVDPSDSHSYSLIVSPDDSGSIDSMGGDAPFTVEAVSDGVNPATVALYELIPTSTSPAPSAIKIGTFTLSASGAVTFNASAITPVITSPALANAAIGVNDSHSFSVTAERATSYQWLFNGSPISGATGTTYTVSSATLGNNGSYSVTASNSSYATHVTSASALLTVTAPTITTVTLPNGTNAVAYSQTISATSGTPGYTFAVGSGALPTGLTLSSGGVLSGTNTAIGVYTFSVVVTDTLAATGTNSYTVRILPTKLDTGAPTVKIVSPLNNGLVTNAPVTVTGTAKDNVFVAAVHYWLDDLNTNNPPTGDAVGTTAWTITLPGISAGQHTIMVQSEDLSGNKTKKSPFIIFHYGTNDFTSLAGTYNGLFNSNGVFAHFNSGYFQTKVKVAAGKLPTFSGSVSVDGNKLSYAGTFELTGVGTLKKVIDRHTKFSKSDLNLTLTLPFDGSGKITGVVGTTNGAWSSVMEGYLAATTNVYAGQYTMVIPGSATNSATEPGGDGYGLVFIDASGLVSVSGSKLADGQNFAQKVGLSASGKWPLYSTASLDSATKETRSAIMGWVTVSNNLLNGTLTWDKQAFAGDTGRYPLGFTTSVEVASSPYDPTTTTVLPYSLNPSNALVTFEGAGLTGVLSNSVTLASAKFTTDKVRKLTLGVTAKTGKLSVGFLNPDDTNLKAAGYGVVLTNSATGAGYFLPSATGTHSSASGEFLLQAQ